METVAKATEVVYVESDPLITAVVRNVKLFNEQTASFNEFYEQMRNYKEEFLKEEVANEEKNIQDEEDDSSVDDGGHESLSDDSLSDSPAESSCNSSRPTDHPSKDNDEISRSQREIVPRGSESEEEIMLLDGNFFSSDPKEDLKKSPKVKFTDLENVFFLSQRRISARTVIRSEPFDFNRLWQKPTNPDKTTSSCARGSLPYLKRNILKLEMPKNLGSTIEEKKSTNFLGKKVGRTKQKSGKKKKEDSHDAKVVPSPTARETGRRGPKGVSKSTTGAPLSEKTDPTLYKKVSWSSPLRSPSTAGAVKKRKSSLVDESGEDNHQLFDGTRSTSPPLKKRKTEDGGKKSGGFPFHLVSYSSTFFGGTKGSIIKEN